MNWRCIEFEYVIFTKNEQCIFENCDFETSNISFQYFIQALCLQKTKGKEVCI